MDVVTLSQEAFSKKCTELISNLDFKPELVIGVMYGGGFVLQEIRSNEYFQQSKFELVKYQRNQKVKKNRGIKILLKLLPYKVSDWMRVLESKKAKKSIASLNLKELSKQEINLKFTSELVKPLQKVLIIDDAIDTGKTMFIIKNNLNRLFPNVQIKIAVISWTIETSIVKPDYFIFKNILVRFPWSKDYKAKDRL